MMTSSNGNIFRVTGLCAGNSPVTGEFPSQRPVTRNFDVVFDLRPNKRLSKQSWGWWFETPSRSLWRHCNAINKFVRRQRIIFFPHLHDTLTTGTFDTWTTFQQRPTLPLKFVIIFPYPNCEKYILLICHSITLAFEKRMWQSYYHMNCKKPKLLTLFGLKSSDFFLRNFCVVVRWSTPRHYP